MNTVIKRFSTPAQAIDFPDDPAKQERLSELWHGSVYGWTRKAQVGNPWSVAYDADRSFYFNESETNVPESKLASVPWGAFPARINEYLAGLSQTQRRELADTGLVEGVDIPKIPHPDTLCGRPADPPTIEYGPYGPRGFQDEYCEWSVTRDAGGKITRIDFTCENPEYWYTLWRVDPKRVLKLYQETLGKPQIRMEDLYLVHGGRVVIDPSTGEPCYNPLNRWNLGTVSTPTAGGAMHLTATPNNLDAQIELGAAATMHRPAESRNDPEKLNCCSGLGQPRRNSDPLIGFAANQLMRDKQRLAIADPVGLYIQKPDLSAFRAPDGSDVRPYFRVVRGSETLPGFGPDRGFILHAVFEVPAGRGFVVGDIRIGRDPIQWGSQVAEHLKVALFARHFSTDQEPREQPCKKAKTNGLPEPLQMLPMELWSAYHGTPVEHPRREVKMFLSSNTTTSAPQMKRGQTLRMALTCDGAEMRGGELPAVDFVARGSAAPDPAVVVKTLRMTTINYAVPGFTLPSDFQLLELEVSVSAAASPGVRDIRVVNAGQTPGPARPQFLIVTP